MTKTAGVIHNIKVKYAKDAPPRFKPIAVIICVEVGPGKTEHNA
jgi:hypothetical protein